MNKQEFQQKIKDMKPPKFFTATTLGEAYDEGFEDAKGNALFESNFLYEPEKPTVPQFVADWYEEHKDNFEIYLSGLCINFTCHRERLNDKLANWYEQLENKPIETLVMMHKFGYEVEKEKLYTVEFPNPNGGERPILYKNRDGKASIIFPSVPCWREVKNAQLTESEIKKDFDWAWQFAEEVEVLDEK